MGVGTTNPTKVYDAAGTAAATVANVEVRKGRYRLDELVSEENEVRAFPKETRARLILVIGERTTGGLTGQATVAIDGLVEYHLGKDDSSDCNSIYDLVDNIFKAISNESTFNAVGASVVSGRWAPVDDDIEDGVAHFELSVTYSIGPC